MTLRRCLACDGLGIIKIYLKTAKKPLETFERECKICSGIGKVEKEEGGRIVSLWKRIVGITTFDEDITNAVKYDKSLNSEALMLMGLVWLVAIIFGIIMPSFALSYIEYGYSYISLFHILIWVFQLIIYHILGTLIFFGACTLVGQLITGRRTSFMEIFRVEAYSYAPNILRIGQFIFIVLLMILGFFIDWIITPFVVWGLFLAYVWWFLAPIYPLKVVFDRNTFTAIIIVILAFLCWGIFAVFYSSIIGKEIVLLPLEPKIGLYIMEEFLELITNIFSIL